MPLTTITTPPPLALKKRHNKSSEDSKFQGTILGKPIDTGDIEVEGGGDIKSIDDWISQRSAIRPRSDGEALVNGTGDGGNDNDEQQRRSRSPSSGLSSVGSRLAQEDRDEMDLS